MYMLGLYLFPSSFARLAFAFMADMTIVGVGRLSQGNPTRELRSANPS